MTYNINPEANWHNQELLKIGCFLPCHYLSLGSCGPVAADVLEVANSQLT